MRYKRLGAASISRTTSSWLSTVGSLCGTFGKMRSSKARSLPLQRALVQEPQRRDADLDGAGLELLLLQQVSLITSQVLRAQLLRRAMEVFGKLSGPHRGSRGSWTVNSCAAEARAACAGEVGSWESPSYDHSP